MALAKLHKGQRNCPKCNSDWDDGSIVDTFKKMRDEGSKYWQKTDEEIEEEVKQCYSPPYRWGREIGIEIQGDYDGISYLRCPDCKTTFNRFTGIEKEIKEI
jgi:hypothetical protein